MDAHAPLGKKIQTYPNIEWCNLLTHVFVGVGSPSQYMSVILLSLSHSPHGVQGTEIQATQAMRRHQGHRFDPAEKGADGAEGICNDLQGIRVTNVQNVATRCQTTFCQNWPLCPANS